MIEEYVQLNPSEAMSWIYLNLETIIYEKSLMQN